MTPTTGMVFLVDDDATVRRSLRRLLLTWNFQVEEFDSAEAFLARSPYDGAACAVLDLMMPGLNGLALQQHLAQVGRTLPIVFLSGHGDVRSAAHAFREGAVDFPTKPVEEQALVDAVRRALQRSVAERHDRGEVAALEALVQRLTPREHQVFTLLATGLANKAIAARLGTTERTIKAHRARVRAKLGTDSLADIVRIADRLGLTPAPAK
jgi:FixJ family two-component response regulator